MRPSEALNLHRAAIRRVVKAHRAENPRVFGSVLRGEDTEHSDIDILVDPCPGMSLMDVAAISVKLTDLLGVPVDVATPDALPDRTSAAILLEAQPI